MFSEIQEEITVSGENKYATKPGENVIKGLQKSAMSSISTPTENLTNTATAVPDAAFHESLHCDSKAVIDHSHHHEPSTVSTLVEACHIDSHNSAHEHEKHDKLEHGHDNCGDDHHTSSHDHHATSHEHTGKDTHEHGHDNCCDDHHTSSHDHHATSHEHTEKDTHDHEHGHAEANISQLPVLNQSRSKVSNIDEEHKEAFCHDEAHLSDHAKSGGTISPIMAPAKDTKSIMHIATAKDKEKEKMNTLFGKLMEQDAKRPEEEQTRFVKMTAGGILVKGPEDDKDDLVDVPDIRKIYLAQPIEKEGAAENWDTFGGAEKQSSTIMPPVVPVIAPEIKKAPNVLSRLIFGDRRGSATDADLLQGSQPESPAEPISPDDDEALPTDVTGPDGKPMRKKSLIMGAMELLRGKKKDLVPAQDLLIVPDEDESPDITPDVCL